MILKDSLLSYVSDLQKKHFGAKIINKEIYHSKMNEVAEIVKILHLDDLYRYKWMELKRLPPGIFARLNIEELKPLYDLSTAMETKSVPSTALVISPDDTLNGYQSMNSRLAGNIARQIELGEDYRDLIDEILDPLLKEHIETYDYFYDNVEV